MIQYQTATQNLEAAQEPIHLLVSCLTQKLVTKPPFPLYNRFLNHYSDKRGNKMSGAKIFTHD